MALQNNPRWKTVEIGLSGLILLTLGFIFVAPSGWFSGQSYATPVGFALGIGVWILPAALSLFAIYHAWLLGLGIRSAIFAGLAALTLLVLLMNFHTTATSPGGLLRYEGRGAFYGPFVSLFTGCLLAIAILISAYEDRVDQS